MGTRSENRETGWKQNTPYQRYSYASFLDEFTDLAFLTPTPKD